MCNCRISADCPLAGKCLTPSAVYEANVEAGTNTTTEYLYKGLTEGIFKARYDKHTSSFRHVDQKTSTELSKKIWELKERNTPFKISWRILRRAQAYRGGMRSCDLCLTEKMLILTCKHKHSLNKRHEIMNKCRHKNKFLLKNWLT